MSNKEIYNAKDKNSQEIRYYYTSKLKISKKEKVFTRLIIPKKKIKNFI
jgi:hypothetical protein